MKKILLISISIILIVGAIAVWRVFPILTAKMRFDYHRSYHHFEIYADQPIDTKILNLFDAVDDRLQHCYLYDTDPTFTVFLCHDKDNYATFAIPLGKSVRSQGMNVQFLGFTFVNLPFISVIRRRYGDNFRYTLAAGDTAHIISHELVHEMLSKTQGNFAMRSVPFWKQEGLAEYYAASAMRKIDPAFSFDHRVAIFLNDGYSELGAYRQQYIRGDLLITFLIEIRQKKIPEILKLETTETELFTALVDWYRRGDLAP